MSTQRITPKQMKYSNAIGKCIDTLQDVSKGVAGEMLDMSSTVLTIILDHLYRHGAFAKAEDVDVLIDSYAERVKEKLKSVRDQSVHSREVH